MLKDDLLAADRQLYPTGRAFLIPEGSDIEKLHISLNVSQEQYYKDVITLLSGLLPDNPAFTEDDASDWERIYGLETNKNLSLEQRKAALYQKVAFPGGLETMQHYLFIENELRTAGFDVYVYENLFPDGGGGYISKSPYEITGDPTIVSFIKYGQTKYGINKYGERYNNIVLANNITEKDDANFDFAGNLSCTFYIGGPSLGTFANVPLERHNEFRQLILNIKPAETVVFLLIKYI